MHMKIKEKKRKNDQPTNQPTNPTPYTAQPEKPQDSMLPVLHSGTFRPDDDISTKRVLFVCSTNSDIISITIKKKKKKLTSPVQTLLVLLIAISKYSKNKNKFPAIFHVTKHKKMFISKGLNIPSQSVGFKSI